MLRGRLILTALCVASAAAFAQEAAVDQLLLTALRERYPLVARWDIKPFASPMTEEGTDASVLRLGPRSAVRVGTRTKWYAVAGFQSVVVVVRTVAAGQALEDRDGELEEKNVLAVACEPLISADALRNARAKRNKRAGEIICVSDIEALPFVARGDEVTVRYVGERVVLVTKGVAQADGALGDALLVRNPHSNDSFRAIVSGNKEVTLHE